MNTRWTLHKNADPNSWKPLWKELLKASPIAQEDQKEYQVLAQLLTQRGINDLEKAKDFTTFTKDKLHDPFLMKGMKEAVNRIEKAISTKEKVMIYGDYDVDGTTSVALMMTFLKPLTSQISYYIPDRYTEGYGISTQGIDTAKKENVGLVIALDCGIKAVDKIEYANELGIDFIICDHHNPGETIPNCIAVLDPKQPDCAYPYKELSGCAIGYKLCQALDTHLELNSPILDNLLDFTAISLACDIVPITGENRVLTALGLERINNNPRPSIAKLLGKKEEGKSISVTDLVFQAGPKINAAGRISSGKKAVDLLLAQDEDEIRFFAEKIHHFNLSRKEEDQKITEEALRMIDENQELQNKNTNVLFKPGWHKGVIGIVASRVIEKYYKPTIILTQTDDDIIGGSVRSVKGFDVYEALEECSSELIQFGGHKYAAGLTLHRSKLNDFTHRFEEVVTRQMTVPQFLLELEYDAEVQLHEISLKMKQFIDKLAPFGPQNMIPHFVSRNVVNSGKSRIVGADQTHLKLDITHPGKRLSVQGIGFGLGHHAPLILSNQPFDILYSLDVNYWNNTRTLQLMVKDIKFPDTQWQ
jgi:single-stranded-DNA-specific exonuclease